MVAKPEIRIAEQPGLGVDGAARPTEDRVVVLPDAVVVLDGATTLRPGLQSGGWYANKLAKALELTLVPTVPLRQALATAITAVATEHDLTPGNAPSSTVAILRWSDETVEALVLADSPIAVFTSTSGCEVVADTRLANARPSTPSPYRTRLRAGAGYGPDHVAALQSSAAEFSKLRNTPGGFWVAEANPKAADHAELRTWPRKDVQAALIATDGVSCGVDDYALFTWPNALATATEHGPQAVLDEVRAAEESDPTATRWPRPKKHDDQALALITFHPN